jgi:mannose-6-phosphate isomerase-like protein (cupin superfamily)
MEYVRPVDFAAFRPAAFHSQFIADRTTGIESSMLICTRVPSAPAPVQGCTSTSPTSSTTSCAAACVQIGDGIYTAEPGNLVFIPAGAPHWNWNEGDADEVHAELIIPAPREGLPTVYPVHVPSLEAKAAVDPHYVRPLDESGFEPDRFSTVPLADRTTGSRACRISVAQVAPGRGTPLHLHTFDQFYFILSGTMQLQIGLEHYTAGPNTYVLLPAGVPHRNWNDGQEAERHLNVQVPEMLPAPEADPPVILP